MGGATNQFQTGILVDPQIVKAIVNGRLVPFLGAGANLCGRPEMASYKQGQYLPSGGELASLASHNATLRMSRVALSMMTAQLCRLCLERHGRHWTKPQSGMQRDALSRGAGISIEPESVAT